MNHRGKPAVLYCSLQHPSDLTKTTTKRSINWIPRILQWGSSYFEQIDQDSGNRIISFEKYCILEKEDIILGNSQPGHVFTRLENYKDFKIQNPISEI